MLKCTCVCVCVRASHLCNYHYDVKAEVPGQHILGKGQHRLFIPFQVTGGPLHGGTGLKLIPGLNIVLP